VSSSEDAIKRVVDAFERSDWSEIDVRSGSLRVHLSKSAPDGRRSPSPTVAEPEPAPGAADDDRLAAASEPSVAPAHPPTGAHVVTSPSPGIFWRSPEPGLPPFADVGDTVQASATLCIVEVMKLMNHVKAGVAGDVVAVYAQNGGSVRKGQALFAIAPLESSA
jgi:acetyl-CoA carboxylase biotin carboxyl carrier protein